jgi:hypothetical protein
MYVCIYITTLYAVFQASPLQHHPGLTHLCLLKLLLFLLQLQAQLPTACAQLLLVMLQLLSHIHRLVMLLPQLRKALPQPYCTRIAAPAACVCLSQLLLQALNLVAQPPHSYHHQRLHLLLLLTARPIGNLTPPE